MKRIMDNIRTTLGQLIDNSDTNDDKSSVTPLLDDDDTVCEQVITQCQREHGKLMTSTSQSLRKKYGDRTVNRVRDRLAKRRQRGNQYQKEQSDQIQNLIESYLTKLNQSEISRL